MKHTKIGNSGLQVGNLGIGTLNWGRDTEPADAAHILAALLNAGGNLLDISPDYGEGDAEAVVGALLDKAFSRTDLVLCGHISANKKGTELRGGRSHLYRSLHETLRTLKTDYLDLLLVPEPDPQIPAVEMLSTLANFVEQGKVRYLGFSRQSAWKSAQFRQIMEDLHLPLPTALAFPYSLLERRTELDNFPMAQALGLGMIAFSPLAAGVLTGKYRNTIPPTSRAATKHLYAMVAPYLEETPRRITEAVAKAADGLGRTPTDVALAWALQNGVACAICGPRTANQADQLFTTEIEELPLQVFNVLNDVSRPYIAYPSL